MPLEPVRFLFCESVNIYFQSLGNPFIDFLFLAITTIGSEPVYFLIASIIYWSFNKKTGIRLMYIILFSAFTAILAKNLFGMPRPPEFLHKIQISGFGFPSGQTQVLAGFWMYLRSKISNQWIIFLGAAAILLVSLSRIYLGVHYAGDVIGGVLFGFSIALISLKTERSIANKLQKLSSKLKYLIAVILPLILIVIAIIQRDLLKEQIEIGLIMGSISVGYLVEEEYIRFEDAANNKQKIKRVLIGISLLSIIYLVLILIIPTIIFFQYISEIF